MGTRRAPIFKGKPSPSLFRMRRMNVEELQEHLQRLREQHEAREHALQHLQTRTGPTVGVRIKRVTEERDRLAGLIEEGEFILHERERKGGQR